MSISGVRKNFAYLFFILNIVVYFFCLMLIDDSLGGRNIAILGSVMLKKAVNSEELKGNYLRAPDIGASIG